MKALRRFDGWWFGKGSPVTLGVFRILMASLAFVNLAMIAIDYDAWFTERGYVPLRVVAQYWGDHPRVNLLDGVTDPAVTLAVYVGTMLAALLAAAGVLTRVSSIALALGYVSLHCRNPLILHGGDLVLRISLMYLALSPCGKAVSLDRLIALRRGRASDPPEPVSLWPQRLMQVQIAVIYFTNFWFKDYGHNWRDGVAVWFPLHLNEFKRFPVPDILTSNSVLLAIATYGTMFAWLSMGTIVFYRPLRRYAILCAAGAHLFIEYSMNIPLFAFLMLATYVNHYDGEEIAAWWDKRMARWRAGHRKPKSLPDDGEPQPA